MGTLVKVVLGGLALFLAFGGPRLLKKGDIPRDRVQKPVASQPATPVSPKEPPASLPEVTVPISSTFRGQPDNLISSVAWLEQNATPIVEMQEARLTYYLLARSDRCNPDSLSACLQQAIQQANIDPVDFQYTYFFDRVMLAGSGTLFWGGRAYLLNYVKLRKAGWTRGDRAFKNTYRCRGFSYKSKKPFEFIDANISDEAIFTPIEKAKYPNGLTASGQEAVDWHTVSVNPFDFPLSVPNNARRASLTERYTLEKKRVPQARSFIVITSADGRMFLTEAMDTGSGVKRSWIDWRIGNTSAEIKYFHGIGSKVKAAGYILKDPGITFEQVLAASKPVASK